MRRIFIILLIFIGKRGDPLVKGMLRHSQKRPGQKGSTDIAKPADEYLRLSDQGLRGKDPRDAAHNSFNAGIKTEFDKSISTIHVIQQAIGRAILNLINNVFYSAPLPSPAGGGFSDTDKRHDPAIWVSTRKMGDKVEIKGRDNGPGISKKNWIKYFYLSSPSSR